MTARLDVVAVGELLIDFVSTTVGVTLAEAPSFEKAAGGAPANVVVGLARLGWAAGFMGQVGDDEFGRFLAETLRQSDVDIRALQFSAEARTALAFVSLMADGERDFMFYRHPSADMLWRFRQQDAAYLDRTRIVHHGSISLIDEPSRASTLAAVATARAHGALISYDPNLRLPLWPSAHAAREGMLAGLRSAQLVKLSQDELEFLSGTNDLATGVEHLWHDDLRLITVTRGAAGCSWFTRDASGAVPGFPIEPVDTTGAGDGFVAGLLAGLLDAELRFDASSLETALRLANAVGGLTTTKRGAIPALPARAEVDHLLATA